MAQEAHNGSQFPSFPNFIPIPFGGLLRPVHWKKENSPPGATLPGTFSSLWLHKIQAEGGEIGDANPLVTHEETDLRLRPQLGALLRSFPATLGQAPARRANG